MAAPFISGTGSQSGMQVRVVLDHTALNNMLSGRTGDLRNVMRGYASRATRNARNLATARLTGGPYASRRTGRYVRSIHSEFPKGDELRIQADVPYAAALELGANPHPIFPRNSGKALLHFQWAQMNMQWVSFPAVSHPGNRPYLILTDAVLQTAQEMGF
jgi:hypothetical protein